QAQGVGLFNGDDAFLAHLVEGFGDEFTDLVVAYGDGCRGSDLLAGFDLGRRGEQLLGDRGNRLLDPALEGDGIGAGGDVAQTLANERLSENGSGGRTVTRNVVGLLGNFLDEFRTDLLVQIGRAHV